MQNDPINETPLKLKPHRGSDLSALFISAAIGYVVTLKASLFAGLIISCLLLILLSRLRNRLHQPLRWWSGIGLCSGSFLGTASSMVNNIHQHGASPANTSLERLLFIVVLGITGFFSGSRVGINPDAVEGRSIGDLLRTLSGTFTGVFGVLVGIAFVLGGLEEARTLSSRLTASLTIIVLGLLGPGWISHQLRMYQRNH
jgi:hypothetical protein